MGPRILEWAKGPAEGGPAAQPGLPGDGVPTGEVRCEQGRERPEKGPLRGHLALRSGSGSGGSWAPLKAPLGFER